MQIFRRLITLGVAVGALLVLALPALADHGYTLLSVTCDPSSQTIVVVFEITKSSSTNDTYVYANGSLVEVFDPDDDEELENGIYQYTVTNAAFTSGANIMVTEDGEGDSTVTTTCDGAGPLPLHLLDGRVNNDFALDIGAPIAIYLGSIDILAIDTATGRGERAVSITDDEIEAAGIPEAGSIILAEGVNPFTGQAITLYRLASGHFQVNTAYADGKPYIVGWLPGPEGLYHGAA